MPNGKCVHVRGCGNSTTRLPGYKPQLQAPRFGFSPCSGYSYAYPPRSGAGRAAPGAGTRQQRYTYTWAEDSDGDAEGEEEWTRHESWSYTDYT